MKVHGTWPTDDQLQAFEAEGAVARPGLTRIK